MTPLILHDLLTQRGCALNEPASDSEIVKMQELIGGTPNWPRFLEIYRCFNGFVSVDQQSLVRIWSIEEILTFCPDYENFEGMIAFSDVQFSAEIVHLSKGSERAVYGMFGAIIASSLDDYMEQIIEDRVQFA